MPVPLPTYLSTRTAIAPPSPFSHRLRRLDTGMPPLHLSGGTSNNFGLLPYETLVADIDAHDTQF